MAMISQGPRSEGWDAQNVVGQPGGGKPRKDGKQEWKFVTHKILVTLGSCCALF